MAFAAKDLSSLNMLGKNLGEAVQNQFRNDLQSANMERENAKKTGINNTLSLFSKAVNDPNLKPEQKQQAKISTMNELIGIGADPKYIDLVDKTLPDYTPKAKQFIQANREGGQDYIFDPNTEDVKPIGSARPIKFSEQPTGKIKQDGELFYKEVAQYDPSTNSFVPKTERFEPWTVAPGASTIKSSKRNEEMERTQAENIIKDFEGNAELSGAFKMFESSGKMKLLQSGKVAEALDGLTDIQKIKIRDYLTAQKVLKKYSVAKPEQPVQDDGFTLSDVRSSYPQLKDKTDQEIIDAYAKQGIKILP